MLVDSREIVPSHNSTWPPHAPSLTHPHDIWRLYKLVVGFYPIHHPADIQASRQFIFAGLFSTRKRTIVNSLALTAFLHTWYFGDINTWHHNEISYTNPLYTGSSPRISCSNFVSTNIMTIININARLYCYVITEINNKCKQSTWLTVGKNSPKTHEAPHTYKHPLMGWFSSTTESDWTETRPWKT
jgi:hypothetical protein